MCCHYNMEVGNTQTYAPGNCSVHPSYSAFTLPKHWLRLNLEGHAIIKQIYHFCSYILNLC